jgi:hypothetical protein
MQVVTTAVLFSQQPKPLLTGVTFEVNVSYTATCKKEVLINQTVPFHMSSFGGGVA